MSYLSRDQIEILGFKCCGENVSISDKASIYGASNISIGDNVRIDDFCVISAGKGGIDIGSYVHIATLSSIIGEAPIVLNDFVGVSSHVAIYSSTDDYLGRALTNPTVPEKYRKVFSDDVIFKKHVIIGSGTVVLPGCTLSEGVSVGAQSLVDSSLDEWCVYSGVPLIKRGRRAKKLLAIEKKMLNNN